MFRRKQIYLDFSIKNAGFVFTVEICDLSVFAYNFYSIVVELSFVQRNKKKLLNLGITQRFSSQRGYFYLGKKFDRGRF